MDLWTLDTAIRNPIFSSAKSIPEKSLSRKLGAVEIRFQKRKLSTCGYRSLVVRATSNKSNDDSSSASGKGFTYDDLGIMIYQKLDLFLALYLNTSELCFSSKLITLELIRNWDYVCEDC